MDFSHGDYGELPSVIVLKAIAEIVSKKVAEFEGLLGNISLSTYNSLLSSIQEANAEEKSKDHFRLETSKAYHTILEAEISSLKKKERQR